MIEHGGKDARNTFVNSSKSTEVHLIGAIEHDHVLPQCFAHVLGSLRFSGTGGSGVPSPMCMPRAWAKVM